MSSGRRAGRIGPLAMVLSMALSIASVAASFTSCFAQQPVAEVAVDAASFAASEQTEARFKTLAQELRCLVCQNQTLFDSTAALAGDLREQIRKQIGEGKSDDQILAFMVERYGDFILYKPPLKATTLLLWGIPFVLLIGGVGLVLRMARRAQVVDEGHAIPHEAISSERLKNARAWLDET